VEEETFDEPGLEEEPLITEEPMVLTQDEEEPAMGEETPEDISEPEAEVLPEEETLFEEEGPEPETLTELLPDTSDITPDEETSVEIEPLDTGTENEIPENNIPWSDIPFRAEIPAGESGRLPEVSAVIGLLNCLKQLAGALPEKDREIFLQSKFSSALESIIDSLSNLGK